MNILKNEQDLITGFDFIVFGEDFARHPHSLEHILRPMFDSNRFIWVETIGLRSPKLSFYDFKRIFEKLKIWFLPHNVDKKNDTKVPRNVFIVSPFMIPFNQFSYIRKLNQILVKKVVQNQIAKHKMNNLITIASVPNACDYIGEFNEKLKIYFCVDEFCLWPGLNQKLVKTLEEKLISKSDLIITTSELLSKTKVHPERETSTITHGVDFEHFNIGPKVLVHDRLKICYFGLFDNRSDQEIILNISTYFPQAEIHILGNVVCSIKKLKDQNNIFFRGPIPYQELPNAIKEMDIFILPYILNDLSHFINPLKLKEYLSTGRPVIATKMPEVLKLKDYLFIGNTADEFIQHIHEIKDRIKPSRDVDSIINFLKNNETWKAKAADLSKIISRNT